MLLWLPPWLTAAQVKEKLKHLLGAHFMGSRYVFDMFFCLFIFVDTILVPH